MKQIAALLLATVALFAFGASSASDRWGWSDLAGSPARPAAHEDSWVPLDALGTDVAGGATRVKVVALAIEPAAAKVPGALSSTLPQLDEAIEAIRTVVAQDHALSATLKARGYGPDDVIGLTHGTGGEVTLFVSDQV